MNIAAAARLRRVLRRPPAVVEAGIVGRGRHGVPGSRRERVDPVGRRQVPGRRAVVAVRRAARRTPNRAAAVAGHPIFRDRADARRRRYADVDDAHELRRDARRDQSGACLRQRHLREHPEQRAGLAPRMRKPRPHLRQSSRWSSSTATRPSRRPPCATSRRPAAASSAPRPGGTTGGGDARDDRRRVRVASLPAAARRRRRSAGPRARVRSRGGVRGARPHEDHPSLAQRHVLRVRRGAACNGAFQWDLFEAIGGANLPGAWDITTGSASIVVGVLDTGILAHPDLSGRTVPGYDMIADSRGRQRRRRPRCRPERPRRLGRRQRVLPGNGAAAAARGTARTSPAPSAPPPTTRATSPASTGSARSCRCACSASAAATPPTSSTR